MDEDEGGLSRGGSRRSGRKVGSARMEVVPVREGAALEEGEEEGGKEMDMSDLPEDRTSCFPSFPDLEFPVQLGTR